MHGKASFHTSVLSVALFAAWSAPGHGQEYAYESGYIRTIEGTVSVQRAQDPEPEPAEVNLPVLAGDRVWTGAGSSVEIRFVDGALVRLDEATKVDFMAFGAEPNIRVWSGNIVVVADAESARVRVDTPSGSLYPQSAGTYRVAVGDDAATTVSVAEGVGELASEQGSVLVAAGQASILEPGAAPREPFVDGGAQTDALAAWRQARQPTEPRRRGVPLAELPSEVHHYVDDLDRYGTWSNDEVHGAVWYPTSVGAGWAPYRNGRWCYTSYGYTWVPYEPWGWAPHHYGRWGYSHHGWYWVPGRHWSPAWVSLAVGPFWVGWSPLGHHGGPVFSYRHGFYGGGHYPHVERRRPFFRRGRHGKAVPRHVYDHGAGWNFSNKSHFGRRGKARLRASDIRSSAASARVLHQGAVFDRSLRPHALGRHNALASRRRVTPFRASPGPARGGVRTTTGQARRRASGRSGIAAPTSDGGVERAQFGSNRGERASRRRGAARTRSAPERADSRVFRTPAGTTRATGARTVRGRSRPTRTRPTRTQPTRTRVRSRSRTFGTGTPSARPAQPRTRGQEFFEGSQRRRAVTRSSNRSGRRSTTRSRPSRSRSRPSNVTQTPRRSPRSSGVNRSIPRGGGGSRATGTRRSGTSRGATRSRGARRRN